MTALMALALAGGAADAQETAGDAAARRDFIRRAELRAADPPLEVLDRVLAEAPTPKIIGGAIAPPGTFRETVALARGGGGPHLQQYCSGVLVGRDAVLTAAHCICPLARPGASEIAHVRDVAVHHGPDISAEKPVPIRRAILYDPRFCESRRAPRGLDIALLLLDREAEGAPPVPAEPARLAPSSLVLSSVTRSLMIVGYGLSEHFTGVKMYARVSVASKICGTRLARLYFACRAGRETVLVGPTGADSCRGDSGGPAYAVLGTEYFLVGITSRAIDPGGTCGPGGIYTLITPRVVNWLKAWGVAVNAVE